MRSIQLGYGQIEEYIIAVKMLIWAFQVDWINEDYRGAGSNAT